MKLPNAATMARLAVTSNHSPRAGVEGGKEEEH
jgi:hypothetical protein